MQMVAAPIQVCTSATSMSLSQRLTNHLSDLGAMKKHLSSETQLNASISKIFVDNTVILRTSNCYLKMTVLHILKYKSLSYSQKPMLKIF